MAKRRGKLQRAIESLEHKKADAVKTFDMAIAELKAQAAAAPAKGQRKDQRTVAPVGTD